MMWQYHSLVFIKLKLNFQSICTFIFITLLLTIAIIVNNLQVQGQMIGYRNHGTRIYIEQNNIQSNKKKILPFCYNTDEFMRKLC